MIMQRDPFAHLTGITRQLADALQAASDHLDYCGYGDPWEQECAEAMGLETQIKQALLAAQGLAGLDHFEHYAHKYQTRIPKKRRTK